MIASYLRLLLSQPRFLAFGFALTLFSSFGQTFYISLSNGAIREEFALSHAQFGGLYSLATLCSAFCLVWAGRLIDDVDLRLYTGVVSALMVLACAAMAFAPTVWLLGAAIFLLRFSGQGLLSHTAMTSMARYFDTTRGKAMSIAGLGFPAGEAILPSVGVAMIAAAGWRSSWLIVAAAVLIVAVPLAQLLLLGHAPRHRAMLQVHAPRLGGACPECGYDLTGHAPIAQMTCPECGMQVLAPPPAPQTMRHQWTRREVLRDKRFYLMLPAILAPGFIVTGLFFHQIHLAQSKGWTMTWFAGCFIAFAAAQLPASLVAGPLVDRFGATRLLRFYILPLGCGSLVLALMEHRLSALLFMVLIGLTSGVASTIVGSMWAEVYGIAHLGSIRAMATSLGVLSTAGSPVLMGLVIDRGVSMELIAAVCCAWTVAATVLLLPLFRS